MADESDEVEYDTITNGYIIAENCGAAISGWPAECRDICLHEFRIALERQGRPMPATVYSACTATDDGKWHIQTSTDAIDGGISNDPSEIGWAVA